MSTDTKPTTTQMAILVSAARRPNGKIEPLPDNLRGGARAKVIEGLLARGLAADADGHMSSGALRADRAGSDRGCRDDP